MYYIYFPFVLIWASLMLYECNKRKHPKWWALTVLLAPITTPYFIFKSRKESGVILFTLFMTTFSFMAGIEFYLYTDYMKKNKFAHLNPVTRQMVRLSEELKISTLKLDTALVKLENLSKVESRIHEIKNTIEFIGTLRILMVENQESINRLVKYTSDFNSFFQKKDLEWVFNLQKFYNNRNVLQHYKSLEKYLEGFEELLEYTYVNFYNITEHKSREHLNNYDEYYLRYRRAVDSHNRFNVKRIEYQNDYLAKFPEIKPYLPGERQTDTFKLWE